MFPTYQEGYEFGRYMERAAIENRWVSLSLWQRLKLAWMGNLEGLWLSH